MANFVAEEVRAVAAALIEISYRLDESGKNIKTVCKHCRRYEYGDIHEDNYRNHSPECVVLVAKDLLTERK